MTAEQINKMFLLFDAVREGMVTEEQLSELDQMLAQDTRMCKYYIEYFNMCTLLKSGKAFDQMHITVPEICNIQFWKSMGDYEKTAPEIELPEEKPLQELIPKVVYPPQEKRKVSKFQIFTLLMSAAAILFFVIFLRFIPEKPYAIEVATLIDQMNVTWADSRIHFQNGDRLWTNQEPVGLEKGIVKIQYDDGVDVLIEAPARFVVERSGIYVEYGRLFSRVSESGLGFLVETPTARFVDQGTEFGVQADVNGSAELHVIKGKVQLFAGSKEKAKSSLVVTENKAIRYNANTGKTEPVPFSSDIYVRAIDSKRKTIWRGENLSLASIVSGYDGFREVEALLGINPATGKYTTSIIQSKRTSEHLYTRVPYSEFIDGVFVPDGESGPVQITSLGQTFDCPNTSGIFTHEIAAYKGSLENQHTTIEPVIFKGKKFEDDPIVMLHSNSGITFDLQAIRESMPELNLKNFKSRGGMTEAISDLEEDQPDIDFWVLVDGQIKYERKMMTLDSEPISFNIELAPQDRFLTLIVTDGLRATDGKREFPYGNDFFYLIDPQLCLIEQP